MEPDKPKVKFNSAVLVHNTPKSETKITIGPITIADINAEIAKMDKGMEFIATTNEKDHLLDAFLAEKEGEQAKDNS